MIWRAGDRLLATVEDGAFVLVDAIGTIVTRYAPSKVGGGGFVTWRSFSVRDDKLIELVEVGTLSGVDEDEDVILDGLRVEDDPEIARFVAIVLADAAACSTPTE